MSAILDLQIACNTDNLPSTEAIQTCLNAPLTELGIDQDQEVTVRVVNCTESRQLNHQYRGKDKPTNVLSFAFESPVGLPVNLLGDMVICAEVVQAEAKAQGKAINDHWAHMLIHGMLHLLGFDHLDDEEAKEMEALEIAILAKLAIDDPYQDH